MKLRWTKVGLTLVGLLALGTALAIIFHASEPITRGRPISYWVGQLGRPGANQVEARSAITQLGPAAVSFLLQDVLEGESFWTRTYAAMWSRLPASLQRRFAKPNIHGYGWLGQVAVALSLAEPPAIEPLTAALQSPKREVQLVAARALALLGGKADAAIPGLVMLMNSAQPEVQFEAVMALEHMGPSRNQAVPALIGLLEDKPGSPIVMWRVREAAVSILGLIGPEARPAVPQLSRLLEDSNTRLRLKSALALWRVNKDPRVVSLLIQELAEARDYDTCALIITSLGEIGPGAKEALPVIMEKANQRSVQTGRYALRSLKIVARRAVSKIDPQAAEMMVKGEPAAPDLRSGVLMDAPTAKKLGLDALDPSP